ncbi:MAG TPA: hypothetical protein VHX36_13635 [Candidatus Acidoferrales bacterium]|jgi:5-methyltetrahydropteroyltriglutamate--homocysteine methyltransferase|nr:hypothetical protein [Candidatus Acidoferrales bacterium]
MRRSTQKILTTHVGSLPGRRDSFVNGDDAGLSEAVCEAIARQRDIGIDVINEGEFTKGGDWLSYIDGRLGGFEQTAEPRDASLLRGKDRETFADFYKFASERGTLFYNPKDKPLVVRKHWVCTGPVTYARKDELQKEVDLFAAALSKSGRDKRDCFFTATAPSSLEPYLTNAYYGSAEEFIVALAEAMRVEYETIADAGFIVQVDDAWLAALWDRIGIPMGLEAFRKYCLLRVEALNHALSSIPEERIRYHLCWGSWHGPHAYDLPLRDLVDVLLRVKAQAYLIEGANPRHEHEYHVWESVRLPAGKILIPGVVAHSTDIVEHPELVSERLQRYTRILGKENVMAGTDCGFGERTHPQIAWAKLSSLVQGAELASRVLF